MMMVGNGGDDGDGDGDTDDDYHDHEHLGGDGGVLATNCQTVVTESICIQHTKWSMSHL